MVIPAGIIEYLLIYGLNLITSGIITIFIMSFIIIAPAEELLKFFAVKKWIYKSIEFDEVMDGIVYTVSASLGFATVENIIYVLSHGIGVGIARAFLAIPGHAFFGALMGYYIGLAKFHKEKENSLIFKGVFFAIFLHGLYNFLLLTQTILALLVIILLIILGFWVRKKLKKAETQSKQRIENESSTVEANEKQTKMSSIEQRVNEKNKDSRNGETANR